MIAATAQNLTLLDAKLPLLKGYESLADVDVVGQRVYDYGSGSVSPVSRLPHCTLVALADRTLTGNASA